MKFTLKFCCSEFPAGAGQLHLFCQNSPALLQKLNQRGRVQRLFMSPLTRRLSRSEGDLYFPDSESQRDSGLSSCSPADNVTPVNIRSKHGSQDSGVRISMASDDSGLVLKSKTASALITTGLGLLGCAPGIIDDGSIDEEFTHDILMPLVHNMKKVNYNRRELGVLIASGIYEEISEAIPEKQIKQTMHGYEDPVDLILRRIVVHHHLYHLESLLIVFELIVIVMML